MPVTSRPAAWSERIAVSRPEPGPLTNTSTRSRPWSMPLRAAASAVTWAANGVDLREPLKPAPPADSHAITLPSRSVRDTIVLLKLVLMCAWPNGMFLRGLRRPPPRRAGRCCAISDFCLFPYRQVRGRQADWPRRGKSGNLHHFLTFFLPATDMRFGPLRVRAFVFVRWPLTG